MEREVSTPDEREHASMTELLPWYVNGTLDDPERARMEMHLRACPLCRADLNLERQVHDLLAAETPIDYIPAASLKRLQGRLDGLGVDAGAKAPVPAIRRETKQSIQWHRAVAASTAILTLAVGFLAADRWMRSGTPALANYHTVTSVRPIPPGEAIRAVFAPTITLVELQTLLDESQLRIVAGPTEAGVYSLAPTSARPIESSLRTLRQNAAVRFAESTQP